MKTRRFRRALPRPFQKFLEWQSAGGVLLLGVTLGALAVANSPLHGWYEMVWETHLTLGLGRFPQLDHSLRFWINDALMAVFFLVVGLEIKRELLVGELSTPRKAMLPVMGAVGGMLMPALLYAALNIGQGSEHLRGWGVATVTDIAFALGILTLLGDRVPLGLKVFLTALAIVDDIGAIVLIVLFYSGGVQWTYLGLMLLVWLVLFGLGRLKVQSPLPYVGLGVLLWLMTLASGIHATVAGVLLALTIPAGAQTQAEVEAEAEQPSLLHRFEQTLTPWASFVILPLFAAANAGVQLPANGLSSLLADTIPLGIVLGLFVGKQAGIFLFARLAVGLRLAELPTGVRWSQLYGAAILGGIGFTMSLFIAALAFPQPGHIVEAKLGILLGSLLSAIVGSLFLLKVLPSRAAMATMES